MLSRKTALAIARREFPNGPESLAKRLGAKVQLRPLGGCDGFCVVKGDRAAIFLNEAPNQPTGKLTSRQRFTLAHELGHIILGVPSVFGETLSDMLSSDDEDEKRVNALAAELLLPHSVVEWYVIELPVVAAVLKRLAKNACVSEVVAALRVANLAKELKLENASVVHFDGSRVKWQWSRTLSMSDKTARCLLKAAREAPHGVFRHDQGDGTTVVASTIENDRFDSATLFVQVLPALLGSNITREERRKALEAILLPDDPKTRGKIQGLVGAYSQRTHRFSSLDEAELDFWKANRRKLSDTLLDSDDGREYVLLRLEQWY